MHSEQVDKECSYVICRTREFNIYGHREFAKLYKGEKNPFAKKPYWITTLNPYQSTTITFEESHPELIALH